jgi:hypothetical protein
LRILFDDGDSPDLRSNGRTNAAAAAVDDEDEDEEDGGDCLVLFPAVGNNMEELVGIGADICVVADKCVVAVVVAN